ncbi:hypothetical protein SERLA73DRAFT_157263 [Serpula lacrymans var. lacrymans S7.3]|uniref:Uncharacterized protein n=1 Tax=Serpula lacrymans var. lacrymans (strain S7.3) TaxID=936435 RepID=F8QI68_SERL3|nr:hypothetical protein SERLA73DRAFT_157263 [Serpula lacrymans var. lacrymans S7.3]
MAWLGHPPDSIGPIYIGWLKTCCKTTWAGHIAQVRKKAERLKGEGPKIGYCNSNNPFACEGREDYHQPINNEDLPADDNDFTTSEQPVKNKKWVTKRIWRNHQFWSFVDEPLAEVQNNANINVEWQEAINLKLNW